jgi:predicted nuclease of predicted toxin-antitoxin system
VVKFLLDANLSPKVARYLVEEFDFDIVSLQGKRLGELPDHEVIRLALAEQRVIITLDRDFSDYYLASPGRSVGIVYLDLPNALRNNPDIIRILSDFFAHQATNIDLELSMVVIREDTIEIHHRI